MDLLDNILFAFISGLTEFLPVSSSAHQRLMQDLFGIEAQSPLIWVAADIGVLIALIVCCKGQLTRLRREQDLLSLAKHRRKRQLDVRAVMDLRLLKTATPLIIAGVLLSGFGEKLIQNLGYLAIALIINGVILYFPRHMSGGNRDSRNMTPADAWLIGIFSAISAIPGLSRIAGILAICALRGTERQTAWYFSLLLSIPAVATKLVMDFVSIFIIGIGGVSFLLILSLILIAAFAFLGAYFGIRGMQNLATRIGYSGFAYYCWGAAFLSLILYLTVS